MGTICTNSYEKDEGTETNDGSRNTLQLTVTMGPNVTVDLILGHYKQHTSQTLLVICEFSNLNHCDPLRDYTKDSSKVIETIVHLRKTSFPVSLIKNCPYRKLHLCILPTYKSEESEEYVQTFKNVLREVCQNCGEVGLEMSSTIDGIHTVHNQLLLGVLLGELKRWEKPFKLQLITHEKKMMNMYKYELLKTDACAIKYQQP